MADKDPISDAVSMLVSRRLPKIKSCPFCGGEATTYVYPDRWELKSFIISAHVECTKCNVRKKVSQDMKTASFEDYIMLFDQAISLWNERAKYIE